MAKIFISYRRADSASPSGRIYDRLVMRFGKKHVFKDVDDVPPGVNFATYIQRSLAECAVALVVIGRSWASVRDEAGARRLDDPRDFVRLEIETALRRGLTVIPVLVEGATMPSQDELPNALQPLALINGLAVRNDPDFSHDMERLIGALEHALPSRGPLGILGRGPGGSASQPPTASPSVALTSAPVAQPLADTSFNSSPAPHAPATPPNSGPSLPAASTTPIAPPSTRSQSRALRHRTSRRAKWLVGLAAVLVVSSLGVLLFMNRGSPPLTPAQLAATHTAGAASAADAQTQAALLSALRPGYKVQAPGCGASAMLFQVLLQYDPNAITCPSNPPVTRMSISEGDDTSLDVDLQGAPLPPRYAISLTVSNLTTCALATWRVATLANSYLSLTFYGPQSASCIGSYFSNDSTCQGQSSSCLQNEHGGSLGSGPHSITLRADGSELTLLLDTTTVASLTESHQPVLTDYFFGLSSNQAGSQPPPTRTVSADFSAFSISAG